MPADGSVCAVCGRQDNDIGMFVWVTSEDVTEPFCPGECLNVLLNMMRDHGQHKEADELAQSTAEQIAGGWRRNAARLGQQP